MNLNPLAHYPLVPARREGMQLWRAALGFSWRSAPKSSYHAARGNQKSMNLNTCMLNQGCSVGTMNPVPTLPSYILQTQKNCLAKLATANAMSMPIIQDSLSTFPCNRI